MTVSTAVTATRQIRTQRARQFSLTLGFPAPELMQNRHDGRHWSYAASEKANARREGYLCALQAMNAAGYEPAEFAQFRVSMAFCPPDRRRRDVSNLHAAMKAALDGIAEAMGVDDSRFVEHAQRMGGMDFDRRGYVSVLVEELHVTNDD